MATRAERFRAAEQRKRHQPDPAIESTKKPRGGRRLAKTADTSKPGVAADDRRWGGESTAARNRTKRGAKNAPYALEDSRASTSRPSRKSTRRSNDKIKHATQLQGRQLRRTTSPKARAERAAVTGIK